MKQGYTKKQTAKSINTVTAIMLFIIVVLALIVLHNASAGLANKPDSVQTIVQREIYRNYSVERTNGKVTTVYIDTDVYNVSGCDALDNNDEGHNCVLVNFDDMWLFLNMVGYQ